MKEKELRKLATCGGCGRKLGEARALFFWKITVDRYAMDHQAMMRQNGLGMMLGHGGLAEVMGPDEDMAKQIGKPVVFSVCQDCFIKPMNLAAKEEILSEDDSEEEAS